MFSIGAIIILSLIIVLFIYLNSIYKKNKEYKESTNSKDLHTRYLELIARKQADSQILSRENKIYGKTSDFDSNKLSGEFSSALPAKQNQNLLPLQEINQKKITPSVQKEDKKPGEKNKENKIRKIIESRRKAEGENNEKNPEEKQNIKKQDAKKEVKQVQLQTQDIKKQDAREKENTAKRGNNEEELEKKEVMQAINEIKAKNSQLQNKILGEQPKDFVIDFLRNQSESLKEQIRELRKKGKDVEILDLELINATSKIDFLNVEFSLKFFRNIFNSLEKVRNELKNYES